MDGTTTISALFGSFQLVCPGHCGYTLGMKTAISIPDAIYAEAERLARRLRKSRSQLYAEAMAAYLRRHDPEALTEAFNRVCAAVDSRPDPFVESAARLALARTEW